ncbi:MAG: hypothetical protein COB81_09575 [Flavobacteriaceae bacterium]|nr:MAG: hypothetical protein COB81_09575 [Flavobacteriaceae bacterium]
MLIIRLSLPSKKIFNYTVFHIMIVCSKSPLEEVFVHETNLNIAQRTEIISWINSYVDTINPEFMMLLDVSKEIPLVYEECFNTLNNCGPNCDVSTLNANVVEEQRGNIVLVDDELKEFSFANVVPVRSCSFNLRYNVMYPDKKAITLLRSVIPIINNELGQPTILLVLLQDITKLTNAVQGTYFEIKCIRHPGVVNESLMSLEGSINNKIKFGISLTKRENQILQLLINGHTSLSISKELFIAKTTVDKHRQNLMRKYKVSNVTQLIRKYLQSVA